MADDDKPKEATPKATIDPNLEAVLTHFARSKEDAYTSRTENHTAVKWLRPVVGEEWSGELQTEEDLIAIHKAFQTDEAESKLIEAFTAETPGVTGDGVVLPLQIDYMMQAERAYRARTTQSFPRAVAHVSCREKGHGQADGVFLGQAIKYFTTLISQGSGG